MEEGVCLRSGLVQGWFLVTDCRSQGAELSLNIICIVDGFGIHKPLIQGLALVLQIFNCLLLRIHFSYQDLLLCAMPYRGKKDAIALQKATAHRGLSKLRCVP
jgi:hypothetical protein